MNNSLVVIFNTPDDKNCLTVGFKSKTQLPCLQDSSESCGKRKTQDCGFAKN